MKNFHSVDFEEYKLAVQGIRSGTSVAGRFIQDCETIAIYCCQNPIHEEIQEEIGEWSTKNFGNENQSKLNGSCLYEIPSLMGMSEELGELTGVVLKAHQGRKFQKEEDRLPAVADALADLDVFRCDFAFRLNLNLMDVLRETWNRVKQRTQKNWEADKKNIDGDGTGDLKSVLKKDVTNVSMFRYREPDELIHSEDDILNFEDDWINPPICLIGTKVLDAKVRTKVDDLEEMVNGGNGFNEPPEVEEI